MHSANTFSVACYDVSAYGNAYLNSTSEVAKGRWRSRRVTLLGAVEDGENEAYGKAWKQHWATVYKKNGTNGRQLKRSTSL